MGYSVEYIRAGFVVVDKGSDHYAVPEPRAVFNGTHQQCSDFAWVMNKAREERLQTNSVPDSEVK